MKTHKKRFLSIIFVFSLGLSACTTPIYGLTAPVTSSSQAIGVSDSYFSGSFVNGLVMGISTCVLIAFAVTHGFFGQEWLLPGQNQNQNQRVEPRRVYRSLHDQRLLAAGVPEQLLPFTKSARKVGNVSYIQLETIDQFDRRIHAVVDSHQKALITQYKQEQGVEDVNLLSEENKRKIHSFDPNGTCAVQTIRIAKLVDGFSSARTIASRNRVLRLINDMNNAKTFLEKEIEDDLRTSWLSGGDLDDRITQHLQRYGLADNSITVLEASSLILLDGPQYLAEILQRKNNRPYIGGDFSHTFIICAGDAQNLGSANKVFSDILNEYNFSSPIQAITLRGQLDSNITNDKHYYVVSLVKRGEDVFYYIFDTKSENDHIHDDYLKNRDKFICDKLLTNESIIDLDAETKAFAKNSMDRIMSTMILEGNLNVKKKND